MFNVFAAASKITVIELSLRVNHNTLFFGPEVKIIYVTLDSSLSFILFDLCLQLELFIIIYIFQHLFD